MLTPGNVSGAKAAPVFLERARRMRYLLGDKGYDADRLRHLIRAAPVMPERRDRKRAVRYDKNRYAGRLIIEMPSATSRTSAATPPGTTRSPPTPSQASLSLPL